MYAYGRDNPTGGTCTGNSYNFANSGVSSLVVGNASVLATTTTLPIESTTTTSILIRTPVPTTVAPTVTTVFAGQVGIDSWSMVASPNPVRPGQQFVLTTTISCGRQMSTSASPYYPSMYYLVNSSPRLNGVYGGPSLSGDRRTATFSVTLTAPATQGDFNMYAYGRDNPTGGTCTGNSYNFSNSPTTRLTVDATPTVTTLAPLINMTLAPLISTTVAPTVTTVAPTVTTVAPTVTTVAPTVTTVAPSVVGLGTLAPLTSTTLESQVIYKVQSERPVSISPDIFKVTIPSAAIQNLFDSVSPEDIKTSLVKIRTNDGKWKTVRATSVIDANIELTPRSQRIEIQLIVEGKDPITYEIVLDRVASSSSKSQNFAMSIALGLFVLLVAMYFLSVIRKRRNEA